MYKYILANSFSPDRVNLKTMLSHYVEHFLTTWVQQLTNITLTLLRRLMS